MRIIIDPGHGGRDPGAVDPIQTVENDQLNTVEAELNCEIGCRVKSYLESEGIVALLTRKPGEFVSLDDRAELANRLKADGFVSIHLNAAANPQAHGFEVFSHPGSRQGARLRDAVLREVAARFPAWTNRGAKTANFAVLRETFCPACLIECGFITHPDEETRLSDPAVRDGLARGIAAGVIKFVAT